MRELKFRAWDIASKKMFYPDTEDGWGIDNGRLHLLPNTILMQYTGLKDKNGVEIYEGDKVTRKDPNKECRWLEIIWHECGFYYKCSCGSILRQPLTLYDDPEVIGNIHF